MKAAHLALLPLFTLVMASTSPDPAIAAQPAQDPHSSAQTTKSRLAAVAEKVRALEEIQAERLFWIDFLDALERGKSDRVWFTAVYVKGSRSAKALSLPSRASGQLRRPLGAGDEWRPVIGITGKGAGRANEGADESGQPVVGLIGLLRAPRVTAKPERDRAVVLEKVRRALDERVPYITKVVLIESELVEQGKRLGPDLVRFVFEAELVRPMRAPGPDAQPADGEPAGREPTLGDAEAELTKLLEELRAQEEQAIHSVSDEPVSFLSDLLELGDALRISAELHRVELIHGLLYSRMRGDTMHPDLRALRADPPPEEVPLDMRREVLALRDIFVLLIDRTPESISWVARLDEGEEEARSSRIRFRVVFTGEWPALARFLTGLARQGSVQFRDYDEFPRSFLVVEDMAYVVAPETDKDAGSGPGGRSTRKWDIIGRMPKHNMLRVALTVALVSPAAEIAAPADNAVEAKAAAPPDDEALDPAALVKRVRDLRRQLSAAKVPEGFPRADVATDPREHKPQEGEKQCGRCGYIVPVDVRRCPWCDPGHPDDSDNDRMPDEWEDRHKGTDSTKPDADADPDGDGFTNLDEFYAGTDPDDPMSIPSPLRATAVYRQPVDIVFKGYTVKQGGEPDMIDPEFWVLQLNYGRDSATQFVPLGGTWHGFRLGPLEKVVQAVQPPGGGQPIQGEVYVLTLQRPGEEPIRLVRGQWARFNETLVDLAVVAGRSAGKVLKGLSPGSSFRAGEDTFRITGIAGGVVSVVDANGRTFELRPPTPPPEPIKRPPDRDKDGISDDWEDAFEGADSTTPDADADPDKDGFSNSQEYIGGSNPDDPKSLPSPFRLTNTYSKPVDLLLKGYIVKAGGDPDATDPAYWVMKMNYGRDSMTELVRLSSTWHGFRVGPLVRTRELVSPGNGLPDYLEDVYALTLQRPGEEPIKIVKGTWARIDETYIDLRVVSGRETGRLLAGGTVGDTFTANGAQYTIAEVGDAAVLIKDAEGTEYLLPLQR